VQRILTPSGVALAVLLSTLLTGPATAADGAFYISGNYCLCATEPDLDDWNLFPVYYIPTTQSDCADPLRAALRIVGVPDDPALQRRFDAVGSMSGDIFGEGAIISDLGPHPGELMIGSIWVYLTAPLATQEWTIEAPIGSGLASAAIDFATDPGVFVPQATHSLVVGIPSTECATCPYPMAGCPFAVEASTWSLIKQLFD